MEKYKTFRELTVGDYIYYGRFHGRNFVVDAFQIISIVLENDKSRKYITEIYNSPYFEDGFKHQITITEKMELDSSDINGVFFTENNKTLVDKMSLIQKAKSFFENNIWQRNLHLKR